MGQMRSDSPAPFYAVFPRSVPFLSFRGAFPSCLSEEHSLPVIPRSIPFLSFRGAFPSCHSEERSDEESGSLSRETRSLAALGMTGGAKGSDDMERPARERKIAG